MAKREITSKSKTGMPHEKETKYLNFLTRAYVVFILAVYPLYTGPEGYNNIPFRKAQLYWIVSIMFLISFLIFYLAHRFSLNGAAVPPKWWKSMSVADWAILGFLILITLSYLFSPYKDIVFLGSANRHDGWLTYFCLLMGYFPISRWYRPQKADAILFAAGSMILCVIGFLQLYGMDFLNLFPYDAPAYTDAAGNRLMTGFSISFRSTIGNIDFVGTYVAMTVIAFGVLYVKANGRLRFLYLIASAMNFAFAIIGDSRAGKVGILGAAVLLLPYWIAKRESMGRALTLFAAWGVTYVTHHWFVLNQVIPNWPENMPRSGRTWMASENALPLIPVLVVSLIALAAGIALLLPGFKAWPKEKTAGILGACLIALGIAVGLCTVEVVGKSVSETNIIYQAREIMHGRIHDDFGSYRVFAWKKSLEAFQRRPLLGTGSDTFIVALSKVMQKESVDKYGVRFDKAHNDFIQILVCNGIPALISYLAFVGGLVVSSVKKSFGDGFMLMALGAVVAYLIQSFFGLDSVIVTPMYWVMAAILRGRQKAVGDPLNETSGVTRSKA